jgi:cytochrome c oxidase subunit 3
MNAVAMEQRKRIHPHKFTLWVGIGSILMMFAGLTSAYIVKRNQANWEAYAFPKFFWYSTVVILLSSLTMHLALKAFKARERVKYRNLISATLGLGLLFMLFQYFAFSELWEQGRALGKTVSVDFLYVIVGLHGAHVIGGIVALVVTFIKAFSAKSKQYDSTPVELMSTYWHFVDALWIYLLVFLLMIR